MDGITNLSTVLSAPFGPRTVLSSLALLIPLSPSLRGVAGESQSSKEAARTSSRSSGFSIGRKSIMMPASSSFLLSVFSSVKSIRTLLSCGEQFCLVIDGTQCPPMALGFVI